MTYNPATGEIPNQTGNTPPTQADIDTALAVLAYAHEIHSVFASPSFTDGSDYQRASVRLIEQGRHLVRLGPAQGTA